MPSVLAPTRGSADKAELENLLKRKLAGIPQNHLPALDLADIIHQSAKAAHFPNIPSVIQLDFLMRNRALIDRASGVAIKRDPLQSLAITRAIFFYRLDSAHQFQRYHDTTRWNLALSIALLSRPDNPSTKAVHLSPAAERFMTTYLTSVMEHHNTPQIFTAREAFIKRWKNGVWDVYTGFGASQKKLLKKDVKYLNAEWEKELDAARRSMGQEEYEMRVAKFVGSIVPGRKDQGLPDTIQWYATPSLSSALPEQIDVDGKENELLDALRVPLDDQVSESVGYDRNVVMVTDLKYAIAALHTARPREMLLALLRLLPSEYEA